MSQPAPERPPREEPRLVDVALALPLARSFSYRLPDEAPLPAPGCRVRVPFGPSTELGFVLGERRLRDLDEVLRKNPLRIREIEEILDEEPWLDASLLRLGRWMSAYYGASLGETLRVMVPVKVLKRPRAVAEEPLPEPDARPRLTAEQKAALDALGPVLRERRFEAFLLKGVTGSGKTEVYLRALAEVLDAGRQAVVLVPEISLTPQMARRFRARLGGQVGIFHSGLSAGERLAVWRGVREGRLRVVLGPRSAIFAPFPDLGLVVVDEEHDGSYKQTDRPRYHARSVALVRAQHAGAAVILGSATPSLESLHNADRGKFRLLELSRRVGGGQRPRVEIADMSGEPGEALGQELAEALDQTLERGEKAMLLLNRRGHSRLRICRSCGEVIRCPRCDISMTYHAGRRALLCHYCGATKPLPPACPSCGGRRWDLVGAGTEQVEMALGMRYPRIPVLRMDLDSTSRKGAHARILERFGRRGPAILLGTQMIAKGHDIPEVTLVGVLSADTGLFLPDFRAAERSWQLLEQVAGRSGRGRSPGRVIVQTLNPEHPVLEALKESLSEDFLQRELADRRQLGYPPFRKLTSLVVSAPEPELAERAAEKLLLRFRREWPDLRVDILGPVEALIPRLKDRHRRQILLKGSLSAAQKAWLPEAFLGVQKDLRRSGALSLDLDVDPQSLS